MFTTLIAKDKRTATLTAAALRKCTTVKECQELLKDRESLASAAGIEEGRVSLASINYAVWSDVFICPECGSDFVFWDHAVDTNDWQVKEQFSCPKCAAVLTKDLSEVAKTLLFDPKLGTTISQTKSVPVLIHYKGPTGKHPKPADDFDLALIEKIQELNFGWDYPSDRMTDGDEARRNDPYGITHVHHFYTKRNLLVLAYYSACMGPSRNYVNITSIANVATRMYRFRSQNGSLGAGGGPLSGTLYIPSLIKEIPVSKMLPEHIKKTAELKGFLGVARSGFIQTTSSTDLSVLPSNSLDYLFIDPPFGGNLMYAELNFIWEAWLRVLTCRAEEAVTDKSQEKDLAVYQKLLLLCFKEFYRILKPGRWMTVEFSNSQASVWNVIQTTLQEAGFVVVIDQP